MSTTSDGPCLSTPQVLDHLGVEKFVLRYWEARIPELVPEMHSGRQRYTPADVDALEAVQALVRTGKSLRQIRAIVRTEGVEALVKAGREVMTSDDSAISLAVPDAVAPRQRESFREVVRIVITRLRANPKPDVDDVLASALVALAERGLPIEALNHATAAAADILTRARSAEAA